MTAFVLRTESGPDAGRTFPIAPVGGIIGRQAGVEIVLGDVQASRRHARLELHCDGVIISDLGSANGTRINGQPLAGSLPLRTGDLIEIGTSRLRLEQATSAPIRPQESQGPTVPQALHEVDTALAGQAGPANAAGRRRCRSPSAWR
jgi:predicted component of type VI protein secretion system